MEKELEKCINKEESNLEAFDEAIKLANKSSQIKKIEFVTEKMGTELKKFLGDDDALIEAIAAALDGKDLKELDDATIISLLTDEEGKSLITVPENAVPVVYYRDVLDMYKTFLETDKMLEQAQKEYEEIQIEMSEAGKTIMSEYETMEEVVMGKLKKVIELNENPEKVEAAKEMLAAMDVNATLKEWAKDMGTRSTENVIHDYNDVQRHRSIYVKYREVSEKKLRITADIAHFAGIEKTYFAEEQYPDNMFIFAIQRHISYFRTPSHLKEGVQVSQLLAKLKRLATGQLTGTAKDEFLEAIKCVLDVYCK